MMQELLELLKSKVGIALLSGIVCFILGCAISSDTKTVSELKYTTEKYEKMISDKDLKISELQNQIDKAKPYLEEIQIKEKEEVEAKKKAEEEKKKAEEEAKKIAEEEAKKKAEEAKVLAEAKGVDTTVVKDSVNKTIKNELNGEVTNTTLISLQVNENMGTEFNKDVIVLANLSWSTKNTENTTKNMLKNYSNHLAATLAKELTDGSEIVLFWEAAYTGLELKYSYSVKSGNAYMQ